MKHTKLTAIILAAMMLLTLFAGCAIPKKKTLPSPSLI